MIANLEVNLAKNPAEKEEIKHEIELLKTKKQEIMKNPDILVSKTPNRKGIQKKGKNFRFPVNSFKVKELLQPENERFTVETTTVPPLTTSSSPNCWALPPPPTIPEEAFINAQIAAARRPSLPIIELSRLNPTINLPIPIRRHSVDTLPSRNLIDLSQRLPAFQSHQLNTTNLPCIEPIMNLPPLVPDPKSTLPEWFLAEKDRVFGRGESKN